MVPNARWIPYVIDQTYADELVPTTGVIAQAQAFDRAAQRYDLFIHTGADHLAFATEDRFSDAVAAWATRCAPPTPARSPMTGIPASSGALGIGATGDYWLSGLAARNDMSGTVAGIVANDAALPARALTALRSVRRSSLSRCRVRALAELEAGCARGDAVAHAADAQRRRRAHGGSAAAGCGRGRSPCARWHG